MLDFALAASVLPVCAWVPSDMSALLGADQEGLTLIRRLSDCISADKNDEKNRLKARGALKPFGSQKLAPCVPRPNIVLSHGRAYRSHLKEMQKSDRPKFEAEPKAFTKNANSLVASGEAIVLPPQCGDMVDFEGEFSIVFGATCHNVSEHEAMSAVAGYTLINDVSARNWVENFISTGDPDLNRMGKQLPTFCPMGPLVVTKDEIPDPHDVTLTTVLNGVNMQSAHTSDLIWTIPFLISYFSQWYLFQPGDVLTTGSPAGVGYAREPKLFMKPGDLVEVRVDAIGTLANTIHNQASPPA